MEGLSPMNFCDLLQVRCNFSKMDDRKIIEVTDTMIHKERISRVLIN